jgi:hypothetical protein
LSINILKKISWSHVFEAELKPDEILTQKDFFDLGESEVTSAISKSKLIFCKGWCFRCFSFLSKHTVSVRQFFEFDKTIDAQTSEENIKLRNDADILIAIHMRLGDYKNHWGGQFYYSTLEYTNLMQKVKTIFQAQGIIKFIVFSNESQSSDSFEGLNVTVSHGSAVYDLSLMSKCDYILGPPSSFSNWASFYGNTPIYYIQDPNISPQRKDFQVRLPLDLGI